MVSFWPPGVPFDTRDMATLIDVLDKQAKRAQRANRK